MMFNDPTPTTERAPDFRIVVSWVEITRRDGKDVRLGYAKTYSAPDLEAAKVMHSRALMSNGWAPETAHDVEIQLTGKDAPKDELPSPEQRRAGFAMMRKALAEATGPLFAGKANPLGPDRKSQAAGERA